MFPLLANPSLQPDRITSLIRGLGTVSGPKKKKYSIPFAPTTHHMIRTSTRILRPILPKINPTRVGQPTSSKDTVTATEPTVLLPDATS